MQFLFWVSNLIPYSGLLYRYASKLLLKDRPINIIPYLKKYFSDRKILICREISKYYEEFIKSDISVLQSFKVEPKGELTLVISDKKLDKVVYIFNESNDFNEIKREINNKILKRYLDDIKLSQSITSKQKMVDKIIYENLLNF